MKISRLLVLATVVAALCMGVPATADVIPAGADSNILAGVISRPALAYQDGDTIQYSVTVLVPAWGTGFGNTCRQENVDVQVTLPNGTVVNFPTIPIIDPGDSFTFNSSDDPNMAYVVNHADEDVNHRVTATLFSESAIAHVSVDDLDNASLTRDIGTTILHPDIAISKSGDIEAFCEGDNPTVTYTYLVDNTGDEDLVVLSVTDDECTSPVYVSGDTNLDTFLNPTETWTYTCSVQLTQTTLNTATVNGEGRFTAEPVSDTSEWLVEEVPAPIVSVSPESASICEGEAGVELCAVVEGGVGPFSYVWSPGGATTECITVTEAGQYCVLVTDDTTGCQARACGTLTVNENPSCTLEAVAPPVCPSASGNFVTALVTGGSGSYATYDWAVIGTGWAIVGDPPYGDTIEYSVAEGADECGAFTLTVTDSEGCQTSCRIEICCTGDTFCGFTQGYWGNAGGKKCGGQTTTELLTALLGFGDVVVGVPGRSITFDTAECIILRLPAGGTPSALPVNLGDADCDTLPSSLVKKNKPEINNVLVGQVVTLTLNVRLGLLPCIEEPDALLGLFVIPDGPFCTVGVGDEGGCPKKVDVGGFAGLTVDELLAIANQALGGADISPYTISGINSAVTAINEGFDECRTIVPCPQAEICDNGCDDDFDGLVDLADPDCAI